ncbi:MAG: ATP-binding protein [Bacteroidia bacterium]
MATKIAFLFKWFCIISIAGCATTARGQLSDIQFEHIVDGDGLHLGRVESVTYDSLGMLWVGGDRLFRYDGSKALVVDKLKTREGASYPQSFRKLRASADGRIWAMDKNNLFLIDPYHLRIDSVISLDLPEYENFDFLINSRQEIWLTVSPLPLVDGGYQSYIFTIKKGDITLADTLRHEERFSPHLSLFNDTLYLAMRNDIYRYSSSGKPLFYTKRIESFVDFHQFSMGNRGGIWLKESTERDGDLEAFFHVNRRNGHATELGLPDEIRRSQTIVLLGHDSVLWVGGVSGSLYQFDVRTSKWQNHIEAIQALPAYAYPNSDTKAIIPGENGVFWLCTTHGLIKIILNNWQAKTYLTKEQKLCSSGFCSMRGIAEDKVGNLYMAYYDNVHKFDKTNSKAYQLLSPKRRPRGSYSLSYTQGKLYWNMIEIDLKTEKSLKLIPWIEEEHAANCVDSDGNVWIFPWLPPRLYRYDPTTKNLENIPLPKQLVVGGQQINQLLYDSLSHSFWVCSSETGLSQISPKGSLLSQYTTDENSPAPMPVNNVKAAYLDPDGHIWIGHSEGLSKLNPGTNEIETFRISKLTQYEVVGILQDDHNGLWLSTNRGIFHFDKASSAFLGFPSESEIAGTEFNRASFYKRKNGTMLFGSMSGTYSFHPDSIYKQIQHQDNRKIVLLQYTQNSTNEAQSYVQTSSLHKLKSVDLDHHNRSIEFDFTLPDFKSKSNIVYSYKLEGFDAKWSELSSYNKLKYSNLPPGRYTLRIRGGADAASRIASERLLKIIVRKAWYKRWWAIALYILLGATLLWALARYELSRRLASSEAQRLQELDNLKTELYTNITHEFRTPLTVILGMADKLNEHPKERTLIQRNSNKLLRLVNQILDISKLEAGLLKPQLQPVEIVSYLRYLSESFHSAAEEKSISLQFKSSIPSLMMDIDEKAIGHIVYNLLSNAIKFTPEGGKVNFQVDKMIGAAKPFLMLKVQDSGKGIAAADLPHIFDRFYQAKNDMSASGVGTGLGLAVTKEMIGLLGGEIDVESVPEKGTVFKVLLEISHESQQPVLTIDKPRKSAVSESEKNEISVSPGEHVTDLPQLLLVEDNADVAAYVKSILEGKYQIEHAQDGEAGVEAAVQSIPDIIISDVMMPRKNGFELCEALKSDERTSHIPIILLTAKATQQDKIAGLKHGADAYLLKPFDKEELDVRLEQLLALRKALQAKFGSMDATPQPEPTREPSLDELFIEKVKVLILDRLDDSELKIADLCEALGMSNMQLYRKLKALTEMTPTLYIRSIRLHHARALLKQGELNISEVAYSVGFSDPSYFGRAFKEAYGLTPTEFVEVEDG